MKAGDLYINPVGLLKIVYVDDNFISYEYLSGEFVGRGVFRRLCTDWGYPEASDLLKALS